MIQSKQFNIDGQVYEVTQLGAKEGRRLLTRLVKVLGPVLGALVEEGNAPQDATGKAISNSLHELAMRLSEADVEHVCDVLSKQTIVMGEGPLDRVFDLHFAGRYGAMCKWIGAALEWNYGDFLGALAVGKSGPLVKAPEQSQ